MSSIMDMLGGGGGDPGAAPAPAPGPDPSQPAGPDDQGGDSTPEDLIQQAIDLVKQAVDLDPDHEDKLNLEDTITKLQKYLASQQQMTDKAMGAGPGVKAIRKASGGGSGGY